MNEMDLEVQTEITISVVQANEGSVLIAKPD